MIAVFAVFLVAAFIADTVALSASLQDPIPDVWAVLFTVAAVAFFLPAKVEAQENRARRATAIDAQDLAEAEFFAKPLSPQPCPLNLGADERCYWRGPAQELMPVRHSERVGYYGGPSVRIARGVYMRAGTSRSHTRSNVTTDIVDHGELFLTNLRIVFSGTIGSKTFPYRNVIKFDSYSDGIGVDVPNAPRVTFVTNEPYAAWTLERISRNDYGAKEPQLTK